MGEGGGIFVGMKSLLQPLGEELPSHSNFSNLFMYVINMLQEHCGVPGYVVRLCDYARIHFVCFVFCFDFGRHSPNKHD